jgi:catechol 2,3-dioxygenase-like lactoylglutathione lyase family enzyme
MLYTAIDHPAISCRDVNRMIDWYCKHLGMQLVVSNGENPPSVLVGYDKNLAGGAKIELMPVKDAGADPDTFARFQPGLRHVALRVSNFDEAYEYLKKLGVKFLFEPGTAVGGGKVVSFRDPEGNELQIVERIAG